MSGIEEPATPPAPPPAAAEAPARRRWRPLTVGAVVIGAALLGWIAYRDARILAGQSADAARFLNAPIPVRVEVARREEITDVIGANGLVEPISFVKVPARVTGVVEKVNVDVGQLVKQGMVLAELEPIIPGAVRAAAQAEVAKAQAQVDVARMQYERISALFKENIISRAEFDRAHLDLEAARASFESAQQSLKKADIDVTLGTKIISPITGIVQERYINPGESIREDRQDFFRVGKIDEVAVVAKVAEEKTPNVQIGHPAEVIFDAFPNQIFVGVVFKIDPSIDPQTRTFNTFVKVANPDLRIKPGLSAYTRIKHYGRALTVPRLAVMNNAGRSSLFVVEGDRARLREVKVQPATFGRLAVTDGIKEGERVVYYKLLKLEDNDLVKIETASPTPAEARRSPGVQ
jgi:membrane fusion protein, multidrug efflux system